MMTYGKPKSKYKAQPVQYDGKRFASKGEKDRYVFLKMMERNGSISNLRLQVRYKLKPTHATYVADFVYETNGKEIIEDYKGVQTPVFKLKRDMMQTLLGLDVKVVTKSNDSIF